MLSDYKFILKFKGYPRWDQDTQDEALKLLFGFYVDNYGDDALVELLEEDLKWFETQQEYEICTIIKDLIELLNEF